MYVGDPDDPKANLTDVLVDLMHLSVRQRALGLEFNHRLEMARQGRTCLSHKILTPILSFPSCPSPLDSFLLSHSVNP